jgi:hypothetical protein
LPTCILPYEGKCVLNIIVDIHGTRKQLDVLVDTGFTASTNYGLKLPAEYANYARAKGATYIMVADGRSVPADTIPDAKLIQMGDHKFDKDGVEVPTIFMNGPRAIGVKFLQSCILNFHGPKKTATIDYVP